MVATFWISLLFIIYAYIGYPLLLLICAKYYPKPVHKFKQDDEPFVSIVIAARNEEKNILDRVNNLLDQCYSPDNMEIIIVSDGSSDRTVDITERLIQDNSKENKNDQEVSSLIKLIKLEKNMGKPYALNVGAENAVGEYIVFTDARQRFEQNAIRELVANFSDPLVGCVSGELVFNENSNTTIKAEMGAYWKYEKWIRKLESSSGSVVGVTGAIYAIRRKLFKPIPNQTLLDDVLIPMNVVLKGYRVIFDSKAIAYDAFSIDISKEKKRKLRTLSGNWQLIDLNPGLFSKDKNPIWWRFVSHKILRLFVPFVLPIIFVISCYCKNGFYTMVLIFQIIIYTFFIIGILLPISRKYRLINIPFFFLSMNIFIFQSFYIWLSGGCKNVWKK